MGGFALGAYWAGMKFENHYCSDNEPYCQKLYALRFPDSVQLGDITKIDASILPAGEWILSGGFPCQDISIAGKGAGIHGDRSGLWFEYWRLIRDLRPRFAIMENVGMLVHRGLREVLGSLAEIGYDAEWQDIRASDVGAPHRRERIWIVAYPSVDLYTARLDNGRNTETAAGSESRDSSKRETPHGKRIRIESGTGGENVPNSSLQLPHGRGETGRGRGESTDGGDVADASIQRLEREKPTRSRSRESGLSSERGDEFPDAKGNEGRRIFEPGVSPDVSADRDWRGQADWWTTEPDVGRLAHGIPHRVDRLGGLGNSIVPQIAELLFRQIMNLI